MSQTPDVNSLLQSANLSPASMQALTVLDIGAQIQAALGIPADQTTVREAVLVTVMPDDSGSISMANNTQHVIEGHNIILDEVLEASKESNNALLHTRYLNGFILNPYTLLAQAKRMDGTNYDPNKGTPLYDSTVALLGTVVAKAQEFAENGQPVRTITLIVTDGYDQHSSRFTKPSMVAPIVRDMLAMENHIIAAMGIHDGTTDFHFTFSEMGIEDKWILTPSNSPSEIRKAFRLFSKSAATASKSAASFSKTAMGGFGTP